MLLVKLSALKSLNSGLLMQAFYIVMCLLMSANTLAAEKSVEVGKHVSSNTNATSMILALLLVLIVVIACAYVLKKFQVTAQGSNKNLQVVSNLHLGTKERVVVVKVADKQLLLGVTAQQITLLDTLEKPLDIPPSKPELFEKSVINLFKKSLNKND